MRELFGVTPNSIKTYFQGTGRAYFNVLKTPLITATEADPIGTATAAAIKLGATRGGFNFSAVPQYEPIEMDGIRPSSLNSERLINYEVKLSFSLAEMSIANIRKALDRSKQTAYAAPNGYTMIEQNMANDGCSWPDYIDNLALEVAYGDCDNLKAAFIVLNKVVNKSGLTISTVDRQVGVSQVEFMAHDDGVNSPYQIWIPTPTA